MPDEDEGCSWWHPFSEGAWPCTYQAPGKEDDMVTERYFVAFNHKGWVVWDRHKNEMAARWPRSNQGREAAHAECDRLNRQVRARNES